MQEEIETGVGSRTIPFVYLKGIMDKLAPVSIINDNLVAPSRAATSKSGGSAGANVATRPSSFPKK